MTDTLSARLQQNLDHVRDRIGDACRVSGRSAEAVTLVAVTKYVDETVIAGLLACGVRDLGENRVQQFEQRLARFGSAAATLDAEHGTGPRWHMIGHLQRNKVRKLIPQVRLLHSLDSLRLAEELAQRAGADCRIDCFVEVNVSGEQSKEGLAPDGVAPLLDQLAGLPAVRVVGLMTMAPRTPTAEQARPFFAGLRELSAELRAAGRPLGPELSMGMSGDFVVAIEEGATLVRVGSALYDGVPRG